MIAKLETNSVPFYRVCETFTTYLFTDPLRETIVHFYVKKMKCSLIYERGPELEKLHHVCTVTLKALTLVYMTDQQYPLAMIGTHAHKREGMRPQLCPTHAGIIRKRNCHSVHTTAKDNNRSSGFVVEENS